MRGERPNRSYIASGYGRKNVVRCAVCEQVIGNISVAFAKYRRPTDHLELVIVALADRIGAAVEEKLDDVLMCRADSEVQRGS